MKPRSDPQNPHPALLDSVIRSPELPRNIKDHLEARVWGGKGMEGGTKAKIEVTLRNKAPSQSHAQGDSGTKDCASTLMPPLLIKASPRLRA